MTPQELRGRIDRFADQVIGLCRSTASDSLSLRLLMQLQDAATSVAANYRAACRAQSKAAEITAILNASRQTAQGRRRQRPNR